MAFQMKSFTAPVMLLLALSCCATDVVSANSVRLPASRNRAMFHAMGSGVGTNTWTNNVTYWINTADLAPDFPLASSVVAEAAAHIASKTCMKFIELSAKPTKGNYVHVQRGTGGCSASPSVLNYGGCANQWPLVTHELLHSMGISHEQQRFDQAEYLLMNYNNVQTAYWDQYYANKVPVFKYDKKSVMHYGDTGFNVNNQKVYTSNFGFNPACSGLSDGDAETIQFVTQNCMIEPVVPRCSVSVDSAVTIGTSYRGNVTFFGLFRAEAMKVTIAGAPALWTRVNLTAGRGTAVNVQLIGDVTLAGQSFNVSATFSNVAGASVTCWSRVTVNSAPYMCNGIPSTDTSRVCSGRGTCNSNVFPQCQCASGYGGPWCEGTATCPWDVKTDFEGLTQCGPWNGGSGSFITGIDAVSRRRTGSAVNTTKIMWYSSAPRYREITFDVWLSAGATAIFTNLFTIWTDSNGKYGSVDMTQGFVPMRVSLDYENGKFYVIVNGSFYTAAAFSTGTTATACAKSATDAACVLGSVSFQPPSGGWLAVDNWNLYCDPAHAYPQLLQPLRAYAPSNNITFRPTRESLPLPIKVLDACQARPSALLTGATVATAADGSATLVLPAPMPAISSPGVIACRFVDGDVMSFSVAPRCPSDVSVGPIAVTKTNVGNGNTFIGRQPAYAVAKVVLLAGVSFITLSFTGSGGVVASVDLHTGNNYVTLKNSTGPSLVKFNVGVASTTNATLLVSFNWTASLVALYVNPASTSSNSATWGTPVFTASMSPMDVAYAGITYWSGIAQGSTIDLYCPAASQGATTFPDEGAIVFATLGPQTSPPATIGTNTGTSSTPAPSLPGSPTGGVIGMSSAARVRGGAVLFAAFILAIVLF